MEEIKKLAYVQPTLDKVVLSTNERIASEACIGTGTVDVPNITGIECDMEDPS